MKLKKDLHLNLDWEHNRGVFQGKVGNFPLTNGMKVDINLTFCVFQNVDDRNKYDMTRLDINDLKVFTSKDEYVFLRPYQEKELVKSITNKITW